ncbi:MAG: MFS transporter [Bacteroidales bacterium]|nr:MFS transporter [Bacteroidales bacterium]
MKKSKNQKYKRNILFLTLHLMFSKRVVGPVMMLLYQAFGLSYSQIGILSSIVWLTDASMEMYGGAISDVHGRKKASLIYGLLGMTSMALFVFGNSFTLFALANIAYGLALAIGSGNASALLYDTLTVLGVEKQYKKFQGRIKFPPKMLSGLIVLLLPYLYLHNIKYPYLLGFGFYLISFITAGLLIEPPRNKKQIKYTTRHTMLNALKEIIANKKVVLALSLDMLFSGFILLMFEYFQPIIKIAGVPLQYFGIIYLFSRLCEGLGSLLLHKLEMHPNKRLLIFEAVLILFALVGFAFSKSYSLIAVILFFSLLSGASDVLMSDILNKNISSENRTTIMSTGNMFDSFFVSATLFALGYVSDRYGVQGMFGIASIVFIFLTVILSLVFKIKLPISKVMGRKT